MSAKTKSHLLGLRTAIYPVKHLNQTKAWYTQALGIAPYFDEPFYVGFNVGGFELGLDPQASTQPGSSHGPLVYWGVADIQAEFGRLVSLGAHAYEAPYNVGGNIWVATVKDPEGNIFGLIQNPDFKA
jgi:lactoylglutathione lyase